MNKEIQEFQESFFFGLSMRQCFFSVLAIAAAVGVYLGTKDTCGTEIAPKSWCFNRRISI